MQCNKPYSDDYLFYDEITGHYVLTEKALVEKVGLNLRARMGERLSSAERYRNRA